MAKVETVI